MPKNKIIPGVFGVLILLIGVFIGRSFDKKDGTRVEGSTSNTEKMTVYKSATCGCCVGWISYMRGQEFEVEEAENYTETVEK